MTLFFPDVNVWVALCDSTHLHNAETWSWLNRLPGNSRLVFSRFTQVALLRLLTNVSVMGSQVHSLREAWRVYDRWMADPRVEFYPEPAAVDTVFRQATMSFAEKQATGVIGDCWHFAFAICAKASLVTFDRGLIDLARKHGHAALIPA